ncbi:MAG: flavodoxin family protein [Clostridiales bacterium]|nr:flavodoxin family protein [Clostridiales bacterium]
MKKILAIIGSNHDPSNTREIVEDVFKKLEYSGMKYEYEAIQLKDYHILECNGCLNCFFTGNCVYDNLDDTTYILDKIYETDILLMACPVYLDNVPGCMKTLIDRFTHFAHLMEFAGKLCFTFVNTSNSGAESVSEYLQRILTLMGLKVLDNYINVFNPQNINLTDNIAMSIAEKISMNYGYSNRELEEVYRINKYTYSNKNSEFNLNINNYYELSYWQQEWIKNADSFQKFTSILMEKRNERNNK